MQISYGADLKILMPFVLAKKDANGLFREYKEKENHFTSYKPQAYVREKDLAWLFIHKHCQNKLRFKAYNSHGLT